MPTLVQGDYIFVKKYSYGLRWPVLEKKFIETGLSDGINIEILSDLDTTTKIKGLPQEEVKPIRPDQD